MNELDVTPEETAMLEARIVGAGWPESWREIARSLYVTLLTGDQAMAPEPAVALAIELTLGIAAHMGGTQPYINQGIDIQRSTMATRVIELLQQHRQDYSHVAQLVGLSERHVRRMESRWLMAERARRQGTLPLD